MRVIQLFRQCTGNTAEELEVLWESGTRHISDCQVLRSVNKAHVMLSFGCEGHPIFGTNRNTFFLLNEGGRWNTLVVPIQPSGIGLTEKLQGGNYQQNATDLVCGHGTSESKNWGILFLPGIVLVSPFACRLNFDGRKHQLKEILTTEEGLLFTYTASMQKVHPKKGKHCRFRFYTMCRTRLS